MRPRLKRLLTNLALLGTTVLVCLAIAEFVVFRYILVPDDVLANVTIDGVVRYIPNTRATFRHPDGRTSLVTINRDGWNSTKPAYSTTRTPDVLRVAVVGDSYVHGAFIDVDEGFPAILERRLKSDGIASEVLRFGMDGAPLSQYLHMLRREVLPVKPDVVVVQLIHNDFDESFRFLRTRYSSAFMKMKRDAEGNPKEIPPNPFRPGLADVLRASATFRYMYYETNLYLKLKSFVSVYFWGGTEEFKPEFISSAVDIRKIADVKQIRFFTRHIMSEMQALAKAEGFKLVFAMDGVREAIYQGKPRDSFKVAALNTIAQTTAKELGIAFIDLQDTFAAEYAKTGKRLEFSYDWHWNERGNVLVGERIAKFIKSHPGLRTIRPITLVSRPAGGPG